MPEKRQTLLWVVDDSRTEAAITERSLGARYQYEYFADGSMVVERISTTPDLPDLLILDWVMPGMTGDEVCRFLRANQRTRELPIIMVTASRIETADVVAGLASGANDYVPRPFAPEELRARVDAALRVKHLADSASRERLRLATVNRFGHALLHAGSSAQTIVDELARTLTATLCDGCSILILPGGAFPPVASTHHRHDPTGGALHSIAAVADPVIHSFTSPADAKAKLPPAYAGYIDRFGLTGLAILPFPIRDPIRGIVTTTREGGAASFDPDDIATIETCIEYASLAVEAAMRFDAERIGREQLDTVLQALPVGILAADGNGVLTLVNSAARVMLPAIAPTLDETFRLAAWTALDGTAHVPNWRHGIDTELRLAVPGELAARTVRVSSLGLHDRGSVTVIQDISAERAIDAERELTANFQEQMLGIVGHDLRNPLGAVIAGVEILQMQADQAPGLMPTVKRIQSSANRMTSIVQQLLDVTRARLGSGIPITPRETSLLAVIDNVLGELRLAHPKARFERIAQDDIRGMWDPDRLEQVVSNLASNAVNYGKIGGPITVAIAREADAAVLTVHNPLRGEPIPQELLETIFTPYRRGKQKAHAGGLGLGLYIVSEIVRAQRGTIVVTSTVADGTVFRVTLPIRRS
ncbi:MAG: ATP-binding protein [Kofleriaceae bacterium]